MHPRTFLLVCLFIALIGCSGLHRTTSVSYEGTALIVNGVRYERSTGLYECAVVVGICTPSSSRPSYGLGLIHIQVNKNDAKAIADLIARYELSITTQHDLSTVSHMFIAVPKFFEEQWVQAFHDEPTIRGAWVNSIYFLP